MAPSPSPIESAVVRTSLFKRHLWPRPISQETASSMLLLSRPATVHPVATPISSFTKGMVTDPLNQPLHRSTLASTDLLSSSPATLTGTVPWTSSLPRVLLLQAFF